MNIYVGNLPFKANEDELRQAFSAFGQVTSVAVIKDQFTGQSRGFGFVEMPNAEEGNAAINGMNGKDMGGRPLKVNEARPRTEGGGGGERRSGPGGGGAGGFRSGPRPGGDRRGGSGGGNDRRGGW